MIGDEKKGKNRKYIFFFPIGKKYAYFFSAIDLKYTKLKKKVDKFSPAART